jgi:hypothetical protein
VANSQEDGTMSNGFVSQIGSWRELHDWLYEGSWHERLGRFRPSYAFRGLSVASHELNTSLARLGNTGCNLENHLLRNFRKYAQQEVALVDSVWNWLAVAQHHGLPTRLLDWTYSPHVALHFATERLDQFGEDGVIWCIDYSQTNQFLPHQLKALLEEEGSDVFTAEMLNRAATTLQEFDELCTHDFVAFFEPPSLDSRITNQFALFSLLSNPTTSLARWLVQRPGMCRKVLLPAGLKWEVRDKLDQANVTERVLYPGLDGLSQWLKRYYTSRVT